MISFYKECMCPWENGKIVRHCTTGRIYKVYQAWCRENNHGYARTAKEFREQLAGYLGGTFADVTTRQKIGNESQDTAVHHGAFGYIGHNECVHAYRIR